MGAQEGIDPSGLAAAAAGAVEKHVSSIFGRLRLPANDEDNRRVLAVLTYLRSG